MFSPHFLLTAFVLLAALATIVRMIVVESRPRKDLNPRLFSTTTILIVACFVALLAAIHLINLAGVVTGRVR